MNEHPILFSGEMVRAILEGRKTQTRRVVKSLHFANCVHECTDGGFEFGVEHADGSGDPIGYLKCPYGKLGDRLWVRESLHISEQGMWLYKADDEPVECATLDEIGMMSNWLIRKTKKNISHCPSILLPRWASRITLDVVNVRVERLQNISGNDAVEEGIEELCRCGEYSKDHGFRSGHSPVLDDYYAIEEYRSLWNSINGKPKPVYVDKKIVSYECFPWSNEDFDESYPGVRQAGVYRGKPITVTGNPWVWVVEFKRVQS